MIIWCPIDHLAAVRLKLLKFSQQTTFKELVNNCAEEVEEENEDDAIIRVVSNDSCSLKVDRPTKQKGRRAGRKA